jgi:hypothetical protein
MIIIDNFISDKQSLEIEEVLQSSVFPWYFNSYVNTPNDPYFQFFHMFLQNGKICSDFFNLLDPILSKINYKELVRIKANFLTRTEKIIQHGFHNDYVDKNIYTSIYYVNTNNGKTIFKNHTNVESHRSKFCFFNSMEEHSGTSCTDKKGRIVININFIPNDKNMIINNQR